MSVYFTDTGSDESRVLTGRAKRRSFDWNGATQVGAMKRWSTSHAMSVLDCKGKSIAVSKPTVNASPEDMTNTNSLKCGAV